MIITKINLNGTEYDIGGALSNDAKSALLQIAEKTAYIDDDGQDYYDALEAAFYPPADLVSISATYTQSGTVYTNTPLDNLKTDLVVTATYSDSSSNTVSAYTLSGTLTVGTSTITVSYGGKTTTFNVTVSETVLYPLPDIAYAKAGSGTWASVSDGNHIKTYTDSNSRGPYIFKDGTMSINAATTHGVMFQIPAGASYEIKIKNIVATGNTDASNVLKFRLCKSDGNAAGIDVNIPTIGDSTPADATASGTLENATDIYSVYGMLYRSVTIDYDVEVRINGARYI